MHFLFTFFVFGIQSLFANGATLLTHEERASGKRVLSNDVMTAVMSDLAQGATHSWEIGTRATALLEYEYPDSFLYSSAASIPPKSANLADVFAIVDAVNAQRPTNPPTFFKDGSAGDPASVGIPFLIRHVYSGSKTSTYLTAAADELNFLLTKVPRTSTGAISHRVSEAQLWVDNLSMAPPFLSYYGALTKNRTLLYEGYRQIMLYRTALLDGSGYFRHIVQGAANTVRDYGHWATGNAWAVNGMLRVLRIIQLSSFASSLTTEQGNLAKWAGLYTTNAWLKQRPDGSLFNYLDDDSTFVDASATALFAASTYRIAVLQKRYPGLNFGTVNVTAADLARQYIVANIGSDGWLQNVVNPIDWHSTSASVHSPEGQAFVVMLAASYRDYTSS